MGQSSASVDNTIRKSNQTRNPLLSSHFASYGGGMKALPNSGGSFGNVAAWLIRFLNKNSRFYVISQLTLKSKSFNEG